MLTDRDNLRLAYFTAWKKQQTQQALTEVEKSIVAAIQDHPEYHAFFSDPSNQTLEEKSVTLETNPFFHLGLHIAVREQIQTNSPPGILAVYAELTNKFASPLQAEHALMSCLAELLWEMQQTGREPDLNHYLTQCKKLV